MGKSTPNVRAEAAKVLLAVLDKGLSLSDALPIGQNRVSERDSALLQEICFGAIRNFAQLDSVCHKLLDKKLKGKQRVFHHLIVVGLYQLTSMRIPEHAAVAETVQGAVSLKAQGLKGLVNGCLRNFMRQRETFMAQTDNLVTQYNHPSWFIKRVQNAYPESWQDVLNENLNRAPMWLRVHTNNIALEEFKAALESANIQFESHPNLDTALQLTTPKPVEQIPGFEQGWFAVQDAAAQHAATILAPVNNNVVLDACAAPGGKTCHIADLAKVELFAADIDENRLARVEQNISRLKVDAQLICGDLADKDITDPLPQFDRILLDAPCSATGVIRRHPDIKWLRRNDDIAQLVSLQRDILENLWSKLKPGGELVYATCSILPDENSLQMQAFLALHPEAKLLPILDKSVDIKNPGWQILPGEHNMDGFYYCRLEKQQEQ